VDTYFESWLEQFSATHDIPFCSAANAGSAKYASNVKLEMASQIASILDSKM